LIDSLTDLLVGLDEDGHPPLVWVIRWSEGGREPVQAAWDAAAAPHAMVTLVLLGWGAERAAVLKEVMQSAFTEVFDGMREVKVPGGFPAKSPAPRREKSTRGRQAAQRIQDYLKTTSPIFPAPSSAPATDDKITWSIPGRTGRTSSGPMRLRYEDSVGEKWFERVQDETGDYAGARDRLQYRVAVTRIRRACPAPPTLEELLRTASAVLT
jgi:hypothetical protein